MPLHLLHRVLLGATVTLFLGVLLSDVAYAPRYEVQWKNFASCLIVDGLLFDGLTLLWALIMLLRADWIRSVWLQRIRRSKCGSKTS